jgi:hypothetical protein
VVASVAALDELMLPALNRHRLLTLPFAREAAFSPACGHAPAWQLRPAHGCQALNHFGCAGRQLIVRVAPRVVDTVRIEYDIDLIGDDGRLYDRMEGFYTVNPRAAAEQSSEAGRSGMAS